MNKTQSKKTQWLSAGMTALGMLMQTQGAWAYIVTVGPDGDVVLYEDLSNVGAVTVSVCPKHTLIRTLPAACSDAYVNALARTDPGIPDHRAPQIWRELLRTMDRSALSEEDRLTLDRAFIQVPALEYSETVLSRLKADLARVEEFKAENPKDYDRAEEKRLQNQIQSLEQSLEPVRPILEAHKKIDALLDSFFSDLKGESLMKFYHDSSDGGEMVMNLLRAPFHVVACGAMNLLKAPVGTLCGTFLASTTGVPTGFWTVEMHRGLRVFHDLISDLRVTSVVANQVNFDQALRACPAGFHLPSLTSPEEYLESDGYPNEGKTEFAQLHDDGAGYVIPELTRNWFWAEHRPENEPAKRNGEFMQYAFKDVMLDMRADTQVRERTNRDGSVICVADHTSDGSVK